MFGVDGSNGFQGLSILQGSYMTNIGSGRHTKSQQISRLEYPVLIVYKILTVYKEQGIEKEQHVPMFVWSP